MPKSSQVAVYSSASPLRHPWRLIQEIIRDIGRSKELIWTIFLRDLRAQFRQSILGYIWLLIPPVATSAVWLLLQSQRILNVETDIPYPVFILIGTTMWISFMNFVNAPLTGFSSGKAVYAKLNVAPEAFIISALLRALLHFCIRVFILVPVFIYFKVVPPNSVYLFPVAAFLLFSIGVSIGLWSIPFGSLYKDIGNALRNLLRFLMYVSPVIYPVRKGGWLGEIMAHNPLTPGIALCRDVLTNGEMTWMKPALIISAIAVVAGIFAFILIRIARPHLIARMGM